MPIFTCAAILFDLDGVLADSTRAVDREWREWAARKGVDGDAIMAIAHGVRTAIPSCTGNFRPTNHPAQWCIF